MQKPLSVEESLKHIVTPVDFEVKVFVTEEKLGGKPIAMNWDEQGRLWVSITTDYPNERQPEGQGRDRIVVCEDTDGDGVCDKVTTFADKLSIATSILPYAGGVIVHQAPVTLFLKDTDGDGKADVRQELLARLGHQRHPRRAEQPALRLRQLDLRRGRLRRLPRRGERRAAELPAGVLSVQGRGRAQPPGRGRQASPLGRVEGPLKVTKLEFLRSDQQQHLGPLLQRGGRTLRQHRERLPDRPHADSEPLLREGSRPDADACCRTSRRTIHFEPITDKVRQVDWHGGFTAASNIAIYTARTYPQEYWNTRRLHLRADRPPDRGDDAEPGRRELSRPLWLEPGGERR